MKKLLLYLLPLMCLVLLAGCEKEPEKRWDYFNTDIIIELRDSDGWNWFDATRPGGNMRDNRVTIDYLGESYRLTYLDPNTRATEPNLPDWDENGRTPFRLRGYFENNVSRVQLFFGEFSVDTKNYRGETFTINWGNGTSSVVKFDLYATSNGKNEPTVHEAIWVESGVGAQTRTDGMLVLLITKD